jgi:ribosomal protein S12 methylthiotransferase
MTASPARKKVGLISLGCPKNQIDAEVMLGRLLAEGYEITADASDADAIIVNTCAFIDDAKKESIDAIFDATRMAEERAGTRVIVTGCLAQRYSDALAGELPEVDAFVPLGDVSGVAAAIEGSATRLPAFPDPYKASFLDDATAARVLTSSPGSAYLKISEGCDHTCSFCAIPSMRGKHRSRPAEDVAREAERLVAQGVKELVLVSQDSSAYGIDRGERHALARLLERLDTIDGLAWIRVMYAYPNTLDDATLDAIASSEKTCKYIDIPLQHASRRVLKAMLRGGSAKSLAALMDKARRVVPDLVLRTTFIVGFPGEEAADFDELLAFARDIEFDHAGVFTYSRQEGTSAFQLGDPVTSAVKEERRAAFMTQQAAISRARNEARVGRRVEVLVDGAHPESEHLLAGRWSGQAPDIDGCVILTDGKALPGQIVHVEIDEGHEYDLVGRVVASRPGGVTASGTRRSVSSARSIR